MKSQLQSITSLWTVQRHWQVKVHELRTSFTQRHESQRVFHTCLPACLQKNTPLLLQRWEVFFFQPFSFTLKPLTSTLLELNYNQQFSKDALLLQVFPTFIWSCRTTTPVWCCMLLPCCLHRLQCPRWAATLEAVPQSSCSDDCVHSEPPDPGIHWGTFHYLQDKVSHVTGRKISRQQLDKAAMTKQGWYWQINVVYFCFIAIKKKSSYIIQS